MCHLARKISFFLFSFSIYSSASKRNFLTSNACTSTEDHIATHFDSSPLMTNSSAQKDLDLIELALRRLPSDDRLLIDGNLHDPPGEDAQSELVRKEKDTELLLRLLDQLHSLKGESDLKDCQNSLPTDDTNSDSEPHGSDKIGGQVSNEEVMEEIRKVKKQNKLTDVILGIIFASNVIWRLSEMAVALLIRKQMSTPFKLIGSFITGNFRVPMAENHSSHNLKASLLPRAEAYAIPHFEAPQLPHIEVPSNFRAEDKVVRILNGKLGYGSAGQAEENISLLDLLQPNRARVLSEYYPLSGRIKKTQDGRKLQVDCTGEGALFVEAATDNTLSLLGELELKPSFEQLLFHFPHTAEVEEVPPLTFQITRFDRGGFVVGVSFHHSLCDARGAVQFLKGVAEIARGEAGLSIQPVWQREFLKPHQHLHLFRFQHDELLESGFIANSSCSMQQQMPIVKTEDLTLTSFFFSSDALQRIKQPIEEEVKEHCTTFIVLAALAWRARTRALGIPLDQAVRLLFAVDVRRFLEPPLAEGYYGNGACMASVHSTTAEEVVNGSLSHAVKAIKKAKLSANEEKIRSSIAFLEMKRLQEITVAPMGLEDTYLTDWRWLGFNEVEFGWGEPVMASPITFLKTSVCPIAFLFPPKKKSGVKIVFCIPLPPLKALQTEMHSLI